MPSTAADTFEEDRTHEGSSATRRTHLFVMLECDRPCAGGSRHALAGIDEVVIGRGSQRSACREVVEGRRRLTLRIPGRWLSSSHARLVDDGAHWVLEDSDSKNGTFLNGVRVQRTIVKDGDLIEVGHTILSIRWGVPTPAEVPVDWDSIAAAGDLPSTLHPQWACELDDLRKIATSKVPVVLVGETGTGKEVLARAIHRMSRRQGRFVAVNCGALPPNLVEGQLFGHVRGAFSGAVGDQLGFVREADGGTLLLDEIGDLPKEAQSTFLRVLQEGEVVPLGRARPVEVDVRVMAATQEPLDTLVGAGTFRADLRARVEGYLAHVPTLRERREDIGILIAALLDKLAPGRNFEIRPDAGRAICNYDWPLNVRELEQSLSRALALAGELPIAKTHLPPLVAAAVHRPEQRYWEDDQLLREQLVTKLREHGGNVAHVARALGRARMQIHRWMARLSIDPNDYRAAKS